MMQDLEPTPPEGISEDEFLHGLATHLAVVLASLERFVSEESQMAKLDEASIKRISRAHAGTARAVDLLCRRREQVRADAREIQSPNQNG